jgi:hypothetical protein
VDHLAYLKGFATFIGQGMLNAVELESSGKSS